MTLPFMRLPVLLGLIAIFFAVDINPVKADYPGAKRNFGVRQEIEGDPDRLIPKSEHFVFAVDGNIFDRALGPKDFYHGVGHWTQIRTEAQLHPTFAINARTIIYAGSSSEGYANPTGFYNLLSFNGNWPNLYGGSKLSIRAVDLDRQTIGNGLLIQEKEMVGAYLRWELRDWQIWAIKESTGVLSLEDDTAIIELSAPARALGVGLVQWTAGSQSGLNHERKPYAYLFGSVPWEQFKFGFETGMRSNKWAGLGYTSFEDSFGILHLNVKGEMRTYRSGFAEDWSRYINHSYISYDQYDKAFTNAMNILSTEDDVVAYAGHLNLRTDFSPRWGMQSLNEISRFVYHSGHSMSRYFYKIGIDVFPITGRRDTLTFFASNKVLVQSYNRPPSERAFGSYPLFKMAPFYGIEANYRF